MATNNTKNRPLRKGPSGPSMSKSVYTGQYTFSGGETLPVTVALATTGVPTLSVFAASTQQPTGVTAPVQCDVYQKGPNLYAVLTPNSVALAGVVQIRAVRVA